MPFGLKVALVIVQILLCLYFIQSRMLIGAIGTGLGAFSLVFGIWADQMTKKKTISSKTEGDK
jgi:lipid-A-disaccharide synthase-like uncharacterized protein